MVVESNGSQGVGSRLNRHGEVCSAASSPRCAVSLDGIYKFEALFARPSWDLFGRQHATFKADAQVRAHTHTFVSPSV